MSRRNTVHNRKDQFGYHQYVEPEPEIDRFQKWWDEGGWMMGVPQDDAREIWNAAKEAE